MLAFVAEATWSGMSRDTHALTFHVCVKSKRNPLRNRFGNWCLQPLGVKKGRRSHQHRKARLQRAILLSKSNSANPQQGLDRGGAIPRRMGMHKKDARTLSKKNTTKRGGSVRSTPPSPLLRCERRCILQDGRTRWRISQLSCPERRSVPDAKQQENAQRQQKG